MPFLARSDRRSSADKAKRHCLSVELAFGLQLVESSGSALGVRLCDRLYALVIVTRLRRVEGLQRRSLTRHPAAVRGTHAFHTGEDTARVAADCGAPAVRVVVRLVVRGQAVQAVGDGGTTASAVWLEQAACQQAAENVATACCHVLLHLRVGVVLGGGGEQAVERVCPRKHDS